MKSIVNFVITVATKRHKTAWDDLWEKLNTGKDPLTVLKLEAKRRKISGPYH